MAFQFGQETVNIGNHFPMNPALIMRRTRKSVTVEPGSGPLIAYSAAEFVKMPA